MTTSIVGAVSDGPKSSKYNSVMNGKMLFNLILFAAPAILARNRHYDVVHCIIIVSYALLNRGKPIISKPIFWASYLSSVGSVFDEFQIAANSCGLDTISYDWNCIISSKMLSVSILINIISLCIGWRNGAKESLNKDIKNK